MTSVEALRVVDGGEVSALRSQSLWHGIASAMTPASPITLSLCRPARPYVGLGYHCALDEIDLDACRRLGLPVVRRQLGGGPVYLDADQLFFQVSLPAAQAPARVDQLYARFLEPAVAAFRELGVPARRNGLNDLAVADRKLSGTAAGRIGEGVTVVGNVLFRFPHQRMAEVLAMPSASLRGEYLRLLRRHLSSLADEGITAIGPAEAARALVRCYGEALGLEPRPGTLTPDEEAEVERWERRLADPAWLAGAPRSRAPGRRIKVSADVSLLAVAEAGLTVEVSVVGDRLERARVAAADLDGAAQRMARALRGCPAHREAIERALAPFGADRHRVVAALTTVLDSKPTRETT